MNNVETYIYPKGLTDKICGITNVAAPLYTCNNIKVGAVNFTNNSTKYNEFYFTTAIGTIITPRGSLVVNFNFNTINSEFLPINKTVKANPTFTSGLYENYKDINVTVFSLDDAKSTRILNITY